MEKKYFYNRTSMELFAISPREYSFFKLQINCETLHV